MSKYIIDVGEAYVKHICGEGDMLCLPVRINEFEDNWLNTDIPLTPYTEPDLDAIRNEAYEKGVQDTKQHWVDAPRSCAYKLGYENGLNDAWEAARKIQDTGGNLNWWIHNVSASEAIEKIQQYEQEQEEIKAGDEVYVEKLKGKAVVMQAGKIMCCTFQNGDTFTPHMEDCKKTGRHFPEIAAVLAKMKEESNEA